VPVCYKPKSSDFSTISYILITKANKMHCFSNLFR